MGKLLGFRAGHSGEKISRQRYVHAHGGLRYPSKILVEFRFLRFHSRLIGPITRFGLATGALINFLGSNTIWSFCSRKLLHYLKTITIKLLSYLYILAKATSYNPDTKHEDYLLITHITVI